MTPETYEEAVVIPKVLADVPNKGVYENTNREIVRYVRKCRVSKARYYKTTVPVVTLSIDRMHSSIRVTDRLAVEGVVQRFFSMHCVGADPSIQRNVVAAISHHIPRLEEEVHRSVQALQKDSSASKKQLEKAAQFEQKARMRRRDNLATALREYVKEGWTEEEVVQIYREALVGDVLEK